MKKIILILSLLLAFGQYTFAFEDVFVEEKPPVTIQEEYPQNYLQPEISFDWLEISQDTRSEQAEKYKNIIFSDNSKINLNKSEFNKQLANYKKDKNYKHHYMLVNNGVTQDEDAKYNPFYYKRNTLIIYAIQYNDDIHHSLYYTAYGKLYYVDITSDEYPNFPYYSMQYERKGNLKSAIYFVSNDIQYMYNSKKEFIGVWYKDKMYNINGEQISTREGW